MIEAGDAAGGAFGEIDGVAAGAAAEFEDVGVLSELELGGDVVGLVGADPAGLAEIVAVGVEANLAIELGGVVLVRYVVGFNLVGHAVAPSR